MRKENFLNKNLKNVKPSATLEMSSKAALMKSKGLPIINLSVGEPDYDTPNIIKEKAHNAIDNGKTKYTAVEGILPLREAICQKFLRENNLNYDNNQIIVSNGAKQVLFLSLASTINASDEVILPAPYWLSYMDMILLVDATPIVVNCSAQNNFKITPKQLEANITSKTKWLILNSPNNPTGAVYTKNELYDLGQILLKYPHIMVLSDDIYEHLIYEDKKFYNLAQVVPQLKDNILLVNGVSKSYAMTGWRLGYGAGPNDLIKAMIMMQSHCTSHASSITQYAVVDILQSDDQEFILKSKKLLQTRRDILYDNIMNIGIFQCHKPCGAFYLWLNCDNIFQNSYIKNSNELVMYLLNEAMVACTSGESFGASNYIRLSYTVDESDIIYACQRISEACNKIL